MKYCPNCHLTFEDDANVCTQCGTALAPIPAAPTFADTTDHTAEFDQKDISDNKIFAMLPYLFSILGVIAALMSGSEYAKFHARQAMKLDIVLLIAALVNIIPFLGWIAYGVWALITLVLVVIAFIQVCKGQAKEPAIISSFKFLK